MLLVLLKQKMNVNSHIYSYVRIYMNASHVFTVLFYILYFTLIPFFSNCSSVCFVCTLSTAIALNKFKDSKILRIQPAPTTTYTADATALDTENTVRYLHADPQPQQQFGKKHAHKFGGDGKKKSLSNQDILK